MDRNELSRFYGFQLGWTLFSMYLVLPVLTPLFLTIGLSLAQIGVAMSIMGITVMLFELPTGSFADHIGRKKVFISSLFMCMMTYLSLLMFPCFYGAMVAMLFWGFGQALFSGTLNAWYVECFQQAQGELTLQQGFARVYGRAQVIGTIGALVCALVLGIFESVFEDQLRPYNLLLLMAIASSCGLWIFTQLRLHESPRFKKPACGMALLLRQQISLTAIACRHPVIWRLLITALFLTPIASAIEKYWPVRLQAMVTEIPVGWVYGVLTATSSLLMALAAIATTMLCRLLNQKLGNVLFVSHLLKLAVVFLLAAAGDLFFFISTFLLFNVSLWLGDSARNQLQHDAVGNEVRSTTESIMSLVTRFGGVFGSLIGGFGADHMGGIINAWYLCAGIGLMGVWFFLSKWLNHLNVK